MTTHTKENGNNEAHHYGVHVITDPSDTKTWPNVPLECPRLPRGRFAHDITVVPNPQNERKRIVVIVGGKYIEAGEEEVSALLLNVTLDEGSNWRWGPSLNQNRADLAVSYCNQFVYAFGGKTGMFSAADSIERIQVSDLVQQNSKKRWTTLNNIRLSKPRYACRATTVHDRFMVVMGGRTQGILGQYCSIVDIIDTMPTMLSASENGQRPFVSLTITPGPSLQKPRASFRSAVLYNKIWIAGGCTPDNTDAERL